MVILENHKGGLEMKIFSTAFCSDNIAAAAAFSFRSHFGA
jgi:hypothetical protein